MPTPSLRAAALTLALTFGLSACPVVATAQTTRGPVQRICHGRVLDKAGAPIKGAIVYLRDERSTTVKSAISEDDGTYRFVQLVQGTDYDLWAQVEQKKSKTKVISSFDSKNDLTLDLTIDK